MQGKLVEVGDLARTRTIVVILNGIVVDICVLLINIAIISIYASVYYKTQLFIRDKQIKMGK